MSERLVFGTSDVMQDALRDLTRYADSTAPLLLIGERGTGKSALARYVHHCSKRTGPFIKTSVAAIPEQLEVTQLSGHRRGAFTGAVSDTKGLLESSHGGTFFLDELGLASARLQELLLHLLEDRCIRRLGEVRDIPVDIRFVAATNADLDALIDAGRFRADLRDRFGYLVVHVPPLRERVEDIAPLAKYFLRQAPVPPVLTDAVIAYLRAAPWPGNVRELQAACQYVLLTAPPGAPIEVSHLPKPLVRSVHDAGGGRSRPLSEADIEDALRQAGDNKAKAARLLGISRTHLYRRRRRRDIDGEHAS